MGYGILATATTTNTSVWTTLANLMNSFYQNLLPVLAIALVVVGIIGIAAWALGFGEKISQIGKSTAFRVIAAVLLILLFPLILSSIWNAIKTSGGTSNLNGLFSI